MKLSNANMNIIPNQNQFLTKDRNVQRDCSQQIQMSSNQNDTSYITRTKIDLEITNV